MNMDKFDQKMSETFSHKSEYNEQRGEGVLIEAIKSYKTKTKYAKYFTWAYLAFATVVILLCFWNFTQTESIKTMLTMVMVILIFHEGTVLMKLWWWTYSSRNAMIENMKLIQIQLSKIELAQYEAKTTFKEKSS